MGPAPVIARVRLAVRRALEGYPPECAVLVACSGGADSTALAVAAAFVCVRSGRRAGLITVEHGLQPGSLAQAERVAEFGYELGLDPVHLVRVKVGEQGGPEAAARAARYAAFERARAGREPVLLGHTADDQAETVLLGLGRGSGARSIAAMRADRGGYLRPLLGLRRADTAEFCRQLDLPVFTDPHNADARYRRVRVRHEVLPLLEEVLAGGVVEALCRTASQVQDDLDALEEIAADVLLAAGTDTAELEITPLGHQPGAVLTRVLKKWAEQSGAAALSAVHVHELTRLIRVWHGQGPVQLPGGVQVQRTSGRLRVIPSEEGPNE